MKPLFNENQQKKLDNFILATEKLHEAVKSFEQSKKEFEESK